MSFLNKLFHYVLIATKKYGIDESHGLSHSMNVLNYAHNIYMDEIEEYPHINHHQNIIYASAILHDMCDKKYMDVEKGLKEIEDFVKTELTPNELTVTKQIMNTMSYSKVKKCGYPNLGFYKKAYHIVREADLLSAYDFDRCMIYKMKMCGYDLEKAFFDAENLFNERMFKHIQDGLFFSNYAKKESVILENIARRRIQAWKKIIYK
jgi:hypothetical protein